MDRKRKLGVVFIGSTVVLLVMLVVFLSGLRPGLFSSPPCGPQIALTHTYDADTETLVLRYDGGDRFRSNGRVIVSITDNETNRVETALWQQPQPDADTLVTPGDRLTITGGRAATAKTVTFSLGRGDHVRVLWLYPRGNPPRDGCEQPSVLAEFTIGNATSTVS